MMRPLPFLLLVSLLLPRICGASGANFRIWTDTEGRRIEAALIGVDGAAATVIRKDGELFDLTAGRLSDEDRAYVRQWRDDHRKTVGTIPLSSLEWPQRVRVPPSSVEVVEESGRSNIYRTEHFEFRCSVQLSRDLVRRFGAVFEATYAAVAALPIGLAPRPHDGGYWVILLYPDREEFVADGGNPSYGAQYSRSTGHVMVPLTSLGVRRTSSSFSYSPDTNPSTLIHEVTHQLMHAWLIRGLPPWLSEGMASYMQTIPYSNGTFHFQNRDVLEYLHSSRAREFGPPWPLVSVTELLGMPRRVWNQTVQDDLAQARKNYYSATLLATHFLHHDGDGDSRRLIRYLQAMNAGLDPDPCNLLLLDGRSDQELESEVLQQFSRRGVRLLGERR